MAETDKNQSGPSNLSGLIIALSIFLAAVIIRHDIPLDIARPIISGNELYHGYSDKSVNARLWQDPFAAVEGAVNGADSECSMRTKTQNKWLHYDNLFRKNNDLDNKSFNKINVLIATTSGAPYAPNTEFRRRMRYAVLSGLDVKNYKPQDYDHIDYFTIGCVVNGKAVATPSRNLHVPFEWFDPIDQDSNTNQSNNNTNPKTRILLLWLDEDYLLGGRPKSFDRLNQIIVSLQKLCKTYQMCDDESIKFSVIGPETTDLFDVLYLDENLKKSKVNFYSYGATSIPKDFKPSRALQSTITNDTRLAEILYEELKWRGIDPKSGHDSIAFVSEWDTEYGRKIVKTMSEVFRENSNYVSLDKFYSRGLDGAISTYKQKNPQPHDGVVKGIKSSGSGKPNDVDNPLSETPFGPGQYDYMRRLAQELKHADEDLRLQNPDSHGIRAIGVFGNDVYDKLVALRALKIYFPETVFFTTDYDAALQMKDQNPYTRNLLVASGFGPELAPCYQKGIPPFRSTYQTSAFYATHLAISKEKANPEEVSKPVIFEIDRNGELVQLGTNETEASECKSQSNLRPKIPPLYPQFSAKVLRFNVIIFFISGILLLASGIYLKLYKLIIPGFIVLVLSQFFIWSRAAQWLVEHGKGEPLIFSGGLSIWPTILCRLVAIFLSIILIILAHSRLDNNMDDFEKSLGLKHIFNSTNNSGASEKLKSFKNPFAFISRYLDYVAAFFDRDKQNFKKNELDKALADYKDSEAFPSKMTRVIILSSLSTAIFCFALDTYGMGEPSLRNYDYNHKIFQVSLWVEIFFVSALCIYIVDSVILCLAFIEDIAKKQTVWPEASTNALMSEIGVRRTLIEKDNQILQSLVDLLFIESRTECILPLVYSPFFVIGLTIFSRSNAFDAFPTCWVAILGDVFAVTLIFFCAHAMNRQAMIVREATLERLENGILRAKSREMRKSKNPFSLASSEQLEKLKDWVVNLQKGAFSAPLQQPLFRGLIMPFAGLGLNLMADYGWLPIL